MTIQEMKITLVALRGAKAIIENTNHRNWENLFAGEDEVIGKLYDEMNLACIYLDHKIEEMGE